MFFEIISQNFSKYFLKMSEELALMLHNTSQLPVQITQYEIERDHKEERETEFGE